MKVRINNSGSRRITRRKIRSNKGKKRKAYGPRTGWSFRGGSQYHIQPRIITNSKTEPRMTTSTMKPRMTLSTMKPLNL